MDALNTIKKYIETLKNVGFIGNTDNLSLLLYIFLTNVNARRIKLGLPESELSVLNTMIEALRSKSFILNDIEALEKLDENGAFVYSTDNSIYYSPKENLLTVIGGTIGDGTISIIQNGQLLGTFSVNQSFDETINIMQSSGENVITFSRPSTTEYYKGSSVDITFAWSARYSTTEQKVYVNGVEVSGITPTTTTYTLTGVTANTSFKVTRKNYDGSLTSAQKNISFYDEAYLGVSDYKITSEDLLADSIKYKAKASTLVVNASKQCVVLAIPTTMSIDSAVSANSEPLTSDFILKETTTYKGKQVKVYVLGDQTTLPLDTTITIKIKNG